MPRRSTAVAVQNLFISYLPVSNNYSFNYSFFVPISRGDMKKWGHVPSRRLKAGMSRSRLILARGKKVIAETARMA